MKTDSQVHVSTAISFTLSIQFNVSTYIFLKAITSLVNMPECLILLLLIRIWNLNLKKERKKKKLGYTELLDSIGYWLSLNLGNFWPLFLQIVHPLSLSSLLMGHSLHTHVCLIVFSRSLKFCSFSHRSIFNFMDFLLFSCPHDSSVATVKWTSYFNVFIFQIQNRHLFFFFYNCHLPNMSFYSLNHCHHTFLLFFQHGIL